MPLAVNTILLGLAVYPTYLVVRDHVPDTTDKFAEERRGGGRTADEESVEARRVEAKEGEKLAIAR